ncbi:MAG: excinuclease ABC subunit UvrA [Planctomycetes bacterium]|nr:excinuclease ABC subunit UvrA [Planctomycetota bacterium]
MDIHGAREHNLKNVSLKIPRDRLVVVTGLSGSGKSSLAFDTIYAEGQRRYMESLSTFAKRFIAQVAKPDVDFMFGLSPVISIEQKTVGRNPRSTVGTMTDIGSYLNLLYSTIGTAHCPYCRAEVPVRSKNQVLEQLLALPEDSVVELRAPVFRIYGEDLNFLFAEVRKKGYRKMYLDGKETDISEEVKVSESREYEMEVVVDKFILKRGIEKQILTGIQNAFSLGEQFIKVQILKTASKSAAEKFYQGFGCPKHRLAVGDLLPEYFMFNAPVSACRTCLGLGTYLQVHPDLLVPDKTRSIRGGCFVKEAFNYQPDNWDGRIMYSLSKHYKFDLDTPFKDLPKKIVNVLFQGTGGGKFPLLQPPDAKVQDNKHLGKPWGFDGIARRIERHYKRYRQKQVAHSGMEAWLEKVMVEHVCPDCKGSRLRQTRLSFSVNGKNIHELGAINFSELRVFLDKIPAHGRQKQAGQQILREIAGRLDLLLGIGLDYLNFNRRSGTLSGGESQRIRLSTQIGSGLMGMLYVLDEPSIGLHPKDNAKMIRTLRRLRDLGNTVIVVEHDEDTIRAADHLVELGPGPGVHGGKIVVEGALSQVLACKESATGQYFSGRKKIATPTTRRKGNGKKLIVHGARENNLKNIRVEIPLGQLVCITGASGSGKSTLVNDILFKALFNRLYDTRVLFGAHDRLEGAEHVDHVINIDQSPIGRNSRSNPSTYIGFYDDIRDLFAKTPEAQARGYNAGRFSFNVKTGRCPECSGEGTIATQLYFMPDVEVRCESCKGARYNPGTLEVTYKGKTIADVLNMPIEEGVGFFEDRPTIAKKIAVLDELGLGYLTLGQSSTTLSGGEAQRIKLSGELSKLQRGKHILYILDEPTTGLHLADIDRLLQCVHRLVDAGHTVLVIEHHLDVIKTADHVIDLGPEGGHSGGEVIACGTPETIAQCKRSFTGQFLKKHL